MANNTPPEQPAKATTKGNKGAPQFDQAILESIVINGDLSKLSPQQKLAYYNHFCQRVGLDPTSQPFKLLKLNGKEILYCDRTGAQQLNKVHEVSHAISSREIVAGVYVVTARAVLPNGRYTESIGAVNVDGAKGESLANAMMKAETKAKRRSTLDLLGLGILEESEATDIPGAQTMSLDEAAKASPQQQQPQGNAPAAQPASAPPPPPANPPAQNAAPAAPQGNPGGQQQQPVANTTGAQYKRKYETAAEVTAVLDGINVDSINPDPIKDVANLYYLNTEIIEQTPELRAAFSAKKNAIYNSPVRAAQGQHGS